jgi:hypothetical protein
MGQLPRYLRHGFLRPTVYVMVQRKEPDIVEHPGAPECDGEGRRKGEGEREAQERG